MQIEKAVLDGAVTRLKLSGKLDIAGAGMVEIPIALAARNSRCVLIDMSNVGFVASLSVRHLVMAAKMLEQRRGRLVLYGLTPQVGEVLTTMGITQIIPCVASEQEARALAAQPT
jgi:anti-sigma B factor antagonist